MVPSPAAFDDPVPASTIARALATASGGREPRTALVLGPGRTSLATALRDRVDVAVTDLPGGLRFASSDARPGSDDGESGQLSFGTLADTDHDVVVCGPLLSSSEARDVDEQTRPLRVLRELGVQRVILTVAGASLRADLGPGTVAVVRDHIDVSGIAPLRGSRAAADGPRFPDLTHAYAPELRRACRALPQVVAASVAGPQLPTPAEVEFLRRGGAEVIVSGLATAVVVAAHAGLEVLALLTVLEWIDPQSPQPSVVEAMLEAADRATPTLAGHVVEVVQGL